MRVFNKLDEFKNRFDYYNNKVKNIPLVGKDIGKLEHNVGEKIKENPQLNEIKNKLESNPIVNKLGRMGSYIAKNPDSIRRIGSDFVQNIGMDASEGAVGGTAAEPGGGTALGAVGGAALGLGKTVFDNWTTLKKIAEQ